MQLYYSFFIGSSSQLQPFQSILGFAQSVERTVSLPEKIGESIYALVHGDMGHALSNIDTLKRMQRDLRESLDAVGARLLVRQVDGVPELAATW